MREIILQRFLQRKGQIAHGKFWDIGSGDFASDSAIMERVINHSCGSRKARRPMDVLSGILNQSEEKTVQTLLQDIDWPVERARRVRESAIDFIHTIRNSKRKPGELENFLQQYAITTEEGLALMALAEALLRVPDKATAHALIKDKVVAAQWLKSSGSSRIGLLRPPLWVCKPPALHCKALFRAWVSR